jgi:hypothetical protein
VQLSSNVARLQLCCESVSHCYANSGHDVCGTRALERAVAGPTLMIVTSDTVIARDK